VFTTVSTSLHLSGLGRGGKVESQHKEREKIKVN
jgi:hypothetical protein